MHNRLVKLDYNETNMALNLRDFGPKDFEAIKQRYINSPLGLMFDDRNPQRQLMERKLAEMVEPRRKKMSEARRAAVNPMISTMSPIEVAVAAGIEKSDQPFSTRLKEQFYKGGDIPGALESRGMAPIPATGLGLAMALAIPGAGELRSAGKLESLLKKSNLSWEVSPMKLGDYKSGMYALVIPDSGRVYGVDTHNDFLRSVDINTPNKSYFIENKLGGVRVTGMGKEVGIGVPNKITPSQHISLTKMFTSKYFPKYVKVGSEDVKINAVEDFNRLMNKLVNEGVPELQFPKSVESVIGKRILQETGGVSKSSPLNQASSIINRLRRTDPDFIKIIDKRARQSGTVQSMSVAPNDRVIVGFIEEQIELLKKSWNDEMTCDIL